MSECSFGVIEMGLSSLKGRDECRSKRRGIEGVCDVVAWVTGEEDVGRRRIERVRHSVCVWQGQTT
jgi:hypothetical protein